MVLTKKHEIKHGKRLGELSQNEGQDSTAVRRLIYKAAAHHSAAIGSSRTEARQLSKKWIQTPSVVVRPQSGNLYQELYIAVFPVFSRSCALYRTICRSASSFERNCASSFIKKKSELMRKSQADLNHASSAPRCAGSPCQGCLPWELSAWRATLICAKRASGGVDKSPLTTAPEARFGHTRPPYLHKTALRRS